MVQDQRIKIQRVKSGVVKHTCQHQSNEDQPEPTTPPKTNWDSCCYVFQAQRMRKVERHLADA